MNDTHLLKKIQHVIQTEIVSKQPNLLYDPIVYSLSQGGKQIRPLFTLMACELFDGDIEKALYPAVGVEVFHNFTLLHDDIMDKAPIRRGQPTVYKKWNENVAILSGDAMFAVAYDFLIRTDSIYVQRIIQAFNRVAIGVCEGQQYDMDFETQDNVAISEYINMIRLKTSVLLGGALEIGGIIGHASDSDLKHLCTFGENIGLAFQLQDDWLDVYSDVEKFGKVHGGDIAVNKKTFLYLKALELANGEQSKQLKHYFSSTNFDAKKKFNTVLSIYNELNISEHTKSEMQKYQGFAMDALSKISVPPLFKDPLKGLAEILLTRQN
ncbi:MAG: polyprenyl synthetase family protein [Bacteroidales bacterium]|jgi:geranylgeranyl diphosphate synthase type II|nr:polyprenyl synthetase family protein [Bacteroidales bacterium]